MKKRIMCLLTIAVFLFSGVVAAFADSSYVVKPGDVLWKIAEDHNVTWQALAKTNELKNPHQIYPGQVLKIVGQELEAKPYAVASEKGKLLSRGVEIPFTFMYPTADNGEKFPLVVMAHGHGGNREEAGGFTRVAEGLAAKGIASIRMEFPGCGESSEPFTQNNLTNMLSDIKASLDYAMAKPMIDADRIGMFGYSMGGRLAMLSVGQDSRYKALAMWAPAGTDGEASILDFMGGREAYDAMNKEAEEKGSVIFTTRWGQKQELGKQWFSDINTSKPLDAIASFAGPVLVVYGDKDDVIYPEVNKAVLKATAKSSKVVEHVVKGADHGFGLFSNEAALSDDTVNTTIEFLTAQLQ